MVARRTGEPIRGYRAGIRGSPPLHRLARNVLQRQSHRKDGVNMSRYVAKTMTAMLVLWVGCGGGLGNDASISKISKLVDDFCERLDTCNLLDQSVEDCIQQSDKALEELTPNELADFETGMQRCLDFQSCNGFESCAFGS